MKTKLPVWMRCLFGHDTRWAGMLLQDDGSWKGYRRCVRCGRQMEVE